MAKSTTECRCNTCGKIFSVEKICRNRAAADSYSTWAEAHMDECPACRRARIVAEANEAAEELIREYNLPEITGVSAKQIAYARDLRAKHLLRKKELVAAYAGQRQAECSEIALKNLHAQALRGAGRYVLASYRTHMLRYEYLPVLFCTGDARRIIDCLTGRY